MKDIIKTDKAPAAIGPHSQAVEVNGMVYTSGVIPVDPATGEIAGSTAADQAEQVFSNLKNLIEASGTTMENIVKTVVFLKDMEDFAAVNGVYAKYFPQPYPARSCVGVARLPKDVMLEVEAIAVK